MCNILRCTGKGIKENDLQVDLGWGKSKANKKEKKRKRKTSIKPDALGIGNSPSNLTAFDTLDFTNSQS